MKEYIIRCENNKFTIKGEIVHCKDCEFCIVEEPISRGIIPDMYCRICCIWGSNVRTDDYCSCGEKQVTGKLNNPDDSLLTEDAEACKEQKSKLDTDLISRQGVIDAIEGTTWYHINKNGEMVSGSTSERKSWYKHDDIMLILNTIPSPPVEPKPTTDDCISRQAAIKALGEEPGIAHDTDEEWAEHDAWVMHRNAIGSLPPVEPKRPKGKWKYGNGNGECPFCGRERQLGWDNFCGFCGADMRGDKE